jgi:hypothetical protein
MTKDLGARTAADCALLLIPVRDVIYWYFSGVPKLVDGVGVAEAEKLAAAAWGGH